MHLAQVVMQVFFFDLMKFMGHLYKICCYHVFDIEVSSMTAASSSSSGSSGINEAQSGSGRLVSKQTD